MRDKIQPGKFLCIEVIHGVTTKVKDDFLALAFKEKPFHQHRRKVQVVNQEDVIFFPVGVIFGAVEPTINNIENVLLLILPAVFEIDEFKVSVDAFCKIHMRIMRRRSSMEVFYF